MMILNFHTRKTYIFILLTCISLILSIEISARQQNKIYVLDCTRSMAGYNGSPNIWEPTKEFLRKELQKEALENPTAKVTILPFQDKVHHPINVDLNNIGWPRLEKVLDGYVQNITATNICDPWLAAEKYIDESCDNYIFLMTDGQDNVNPENRLTDILENFCGKYKNTNGFYIELTKAAAVPESVQRVIDVCDNIRVISGDNGIPSFGCPSDNVINVNTRDLPVDVELGFSNAGTFAAKLQNHNNQFVDISINDGHISKGKVSFHIESKFGDNIETLNKAINSPAVRIPITVESEDVTITNPDVDIILHTTPLRSLSLSNEGSEMERAKPFLWIKGNPVDTLTWDLEPVFNEQAQADGAYAIFKVKPEGDLADLTVLYNDTPLERDSTISVMANEDAKIQILVPQTAKDRDVNLTLTEIASKNIDRINDKRPENYSLAVAGSYKTKTTLTEIIFWIIVGLIVLFLIAWFGFIRNQKYPKFQKGVINVQYPYFASLRAKGYRMIVMGPKKREQGWFDKVWRGKILYHVNQSWPSEVEVAPSGKNMRFRCREGNLISSPSPLWTRGGIYKIEDPQNPSSKIEININ